jgi:hypothetical protein
MSTGSGSRSFWSSAHDQDETQQSYQDWISSQHQTPPPDPTQYSQHEQGYMLPPRHRQPPVCMYSPSPFQAGPPPRRGRGRGRGQ